MKNKKQIKITGNQFKVIEKITDEQAGELFKAIGKYLNGEEQNINDKLVQGLFLAFIHLKNVN